MLKFIPKTETNEVICVRINSEKLGIIDKLAYQNNMSRNKFIIQCIDFALEHSDCEKPNS